MIQKQEEPAVQGRAFGCLAGQPDTPMDNKIHGKPQRACCLMADRKPRESDDDYPSIARSGRWRIIRCRDDTQWIVQRDERRGPAGCDLRPWRGVAYVASDRFLREVISRPSLGIPRDDLAVLLILAALPEHIAVAHHG